MKQFCFKSEEATAYVHAYTGNHAGDVLTAVMLTSKNPKVQRLFAGTWTCSHIVPDGTTEIPKEHTCAIIDNRHDEPHKVVVYTKS